MSYETVPGLQGAVAAAVFEKLTSFIAPEHLSFGGGTVLAARWKHRKPLAVVLFCEPTTYGRLSPRERERIESAINEIAGCAPSQTWCEDIATYTEINGIEVTLLPGSIVIEPSEPTMLPGTALALQCSAQILYAKIAWRMYETGEIAARDAYDLACALRRGPAGARAGVRAREPTGALNAIGDHQATSRGMVGRVGQAADRVPLRVVGSGVAAGVA